ncbi:MULTISPECIES: hypothetical protein [Pseudomonas]|jgi:hypothetical protein|uniref:hypothetical protein n=1 Tax=Pseudomonas sp. BF-RE-29 TaxID=2832378 RepID=UPI001CC08B7F|nr:hypothetical protein [Pseudomonas sp. BF-RE-29]
MANSKHLLYGLMKPVTLEKAFDQRLTATTQGSDKSALIVDDWIKEADHSQ